jgi:hypothetical protein
MITDNATIAEEKCQFNALGIILDGGKKFLLLILG